MRNITKLGLLGILVVLLGTGCASTPAIGPFSYMAKQHTEKQRMYRAAAIALPHDKLGDAADVIESDMPVVMKRKTIAAWAGANGAAGIGVNLLALPEITTKEAVVEFLGALGDLGLYYGAYQGIESLTQSSEDNDNNRSISVGTTGNNNSYSITVNETNMDDHSDNHSDNRTTDE